MKTQRFLNSSLTFSKYFFLLTELTVHTPNYCVSCLKLQARHYLHATAKTIQLYCNLQFYVSDHLTKNVTRKNVYVVYPRQFVLLCSYTSVISYC